MTEHGLRGALHIVHVDPAALALERRKLGQQQAGKPRHALLVVPSLMLQACVSNAQGEVLRLPHRAYADNFFAKLARCAFFGQQAEHYPSGALSAQGDFKFNAFGRKRRSCRFAQGFGGS